MQAALPLPLPLAHSRLPGLHLRRLRVSDTAAFHAAVTTFEIGRMLFRFPADSPVEHAEQYLAELAPRNDPPFRVAIDAGDGQFLGSIGLVGEAGNALAYFLTPPAQGQGIMQAALAGFVGMVLARAPDAVLQAEVYHDNPASMRLLQRIGFVEAGTRIATCSAQRCGAETLHLFTFRRA
jgi:ribosomal-protein-alanine N-acetyltransferase